MLRTGTEYELALRFVGTAEPAQSRPEQEVRHGEAGVQIQGTPQLSGGAFRIREGEEYPPQPGESLGGRRGELHGTLEGGPGGFEATGFEQRVARRCWAGA